MDNDEGNRKVELATEKVKVGEEDEGEDLHLPSSNSLLGRRGRRTGNNLYIKIPPKAPRQEDDSESGDSEEPGPTATTSTTADSGSNMRRNSISMPVLNTMDLDALRLLHEKAVQQKMDSIENASSIASSRNSIPASIHVEDEKNFDSSSSDEDKPRKQMMFRTKRRSSIAPLPALRLNDKDIMANEMDSQSIITQNSISSINSLASLLKEKLQNMPSFIRKKREKTKEFKVKAFVALLFLLIVFLVSYAYIMYDYKVLSKMYFERIKFKDSTRSLRIYGPDKKQVLLRGSLGLHTHLGPKPVRCQTSDLDELCFEWGRKAKLFISQSELTGSINCFDIRWEPLDEHIRAMDCYKMDVGVHWFGGGLTHDNAWPLEEADVPLTPFVTGQGRMRGGQKRGKESFSSSSLSPWGNVLRRYFINSNGVAIEVDKDSPLYVSINANQSKEFCMKARYDDYAFANRMTKYPELAYRICTNSGDMLSLHRQLTQTSLWDGLRENEVNLMHSLMEEPVWQVTDPAVGVDSATITPATVERYTEEIIGMGFARLGHVLFDSDAWQKNSGDFTVDTERFGQFGEMVNVLQRRGFKVALTVQPFISTKSPMFAEAVEKRLLITERLSNNNEDGSAVPALTNYKRSAGGVLDITKAEAIPWLLEKLNRLVEEHKVNGFYLDLGSAAAIPRYYQTNYALRNPDQYKQRFMQAVDGLLNVIGVSGAVQVPNPPTFVSLLAVESSWRGLQATLTSAISSSVLGYPFLLSNAIGGDELVDGAIPGGWALNGTVQLPDEELFIRWLQLASFLPAMKFTHLPSQFRSERVLEAAKELFAIRNKYTIPLFRKYMPDAINDATALIRPLWMLDEADSTCFYVHDEFAVGPEIIVAPILEHGQRRREVYLPIGVWKDGIDGSLRKGSRWIHNYQVPLDKVAYFIKMPDNTRF